MLGYVIEKLNCGHEKVLRFDDVCSRKNVILSRSEEGLNAKLGEDDHLI